MSVHYKFKSSLEFDTISFDGLHISVEDLKKAIIHQKRLGKTQDFDLQITNAQTKEEYGEDSCLIPKNTSLIIARVPLTRQIKKSWDPNAEKSASAASARAHKNLESQAGNVDLSQMNGTEEEKIHAMMRQSTMDYDPHNYQKVRGGSQVGEVPSSYRCYKCQKSGHWIKNCPLNVHHENTHTEVKRHTGIPKSFIDAATGAPIVETGPSPAMLPEKKQEVPEDLICSICKDLFTDAVMIPCCGTSFCDECVRTALLDSDDNECPDCNEKGSSPGSLIPNRFLRTSVNAFKNKTGYIKPQIQKKPRPPPPVQSETKNEDSQSPIAESKPTAATPADDSSASPIRSELNQEKSPVPKEEEKTIEAAPVAVNKEIELLVEKESCDTPRTGTPHEESDFEDNITVTVPTVQMQNNTSYHDRHLNGRHGRYGMKPPGLDTPPKNSHNYQYQHSHEDESSSGNIDDKDQFSQDSMSKSNQDKNMNQYGMPPHSMANTHPSQMSSMSGHYDNHPYSQQGPPMQHRGMPPNQYSQGPMPNQMQQMPQPHYDAYGMPIHPNQGYPPHYANQPPLNVMPRPQYMRPNYHGGNIMQSHNQMMQQPMRPRHQAPMPTSNVVANAYQGIAQKIGTGIIDDPLEAFNRIMREKERRKEEQRTQGNVSPRRRSRSPEHRRRSLERRRSPIHAARRNSPDGRRGRSPVDKRGRSPSGRRSPDERRRRRSNSFHSRSFSRSPSRTSRRHSRSPANRKRTRSPIQQRRSRSRSGSYSGSRSRSRSRSLHSRNFKGYSTNSRFSTHRLTPLRAPSPIRNNRFRDNNNRRDGRDNRDEYRERSPQHYQNNRSRGSYRGRGRGSFYRQDRGSHQMGSHQQSSSYYNDPSGQMNSGYHNAPYSHDMQSNRYPPVQSSSSPQGAMHMDGMPNDYPIPMSGDAPSNNYENESNSFRGNDRMYDVVPPGTEPLPPGFEGEAPLRYSQDRDWNIRPMEDGAHTPDRHAQSPNQRSRQNYAGQRKPSNEQDARDREYNREKDRGDRDGRSKNNNDERSTDRRRHSKSRTDRKHHSQSPEPEKAKSKDRDRSSHNKNKDVEKKDDADKREKRTKEKKKKKKEEKSQDKKKKKDRKDKKEKDGSKKDREKKSSKSHKDDNPVGEDKPNTEEESDHHNETADSNIDEKSNEPNQASTPQDQNRIVSPKVDNVNDGTFDLYGDISEPIVSLETKENDENPQNDSPDRLNQSELILDIHPEENDFAESVVESQQKPSGNDDLFAPIPELSKWERDDDLAGIEKKHDMLDLSPNGDQSQVTSEVLKRAEKAIFARAINAIRPIEIKKISADRHKLYSGEKPDEDMPLHNPQPDLANVQITVPVNSTEQSERSVEIKGNGKRARSPVRSVKERLGRIVNDNVRSRSNTPPRKIIVEGVHLQKRSKSRERRTRDDRSRDNKDNNRRDVRRNDKDTSSDRNRDRSDMRKDRTDLRDARNNSNNNYDRNNRDQRDNHRPSRDNRRNDNEITRRRDEPPRNRSRERDNNRRDEQRPRMDKINRNAGRDRDLERARELARIRERERAKEREIKNNPDRSSDRGRERKTSSDRHTKNDPKIDLNDKNSNEIKSSENNKESLLERKRSGIDEANFIPDYDEQMFDENPSNELKTKTDKTSEDFKPKAVESSSSGLPKKRSRSESASSSSSSDSDSSDSSSESEDRKRKKRKHKKQKKTKRASSSGSDDSNSKKKKRKSKKSKKKKKTKK